MTQKFSYFTSEPKAEGTNEKKKLFPVTVLFPPIRESFFTLFHF